MTDVRARTSTSARNGLRYLLYGFGLLLALLTASCGNTIYSVGTPVITLTAKPGRFTSYIVTIDEVQLTRNDGAVVTLPAFSQRVDLANISANYQLLEAPAVAIGTYTAITFILDYSVETPVVTVDYNGAVYATSLVDPSTAAAPSTETIEVKFDPNHPFVVNDQKSSLLAIDIDLEASNIVTLPPVNNLATVTVKPFWNVNANPTYDKPVFARGLYVLADTKNSDFVMNVRPLHDLVDSPFGALKVNVDNNTYWNVNGTAYVGAAGLAALNALQNIYADLQIAAVGPPSGNPFPDLTTITPTFTASQVYVGSSLESTIEDQATGVVSAISSDGKTITLQRATTVDHAGNFGYTLYGLPVTVGPNTIVSMDGVMPSPAPTTSSISVGQVITVQGLGTEPDYPADFNFSGLDATGTVISGSQIRIQNTPVLATFNSANSATDALVNLVTVDGLEPGLLSFTANPASFEITTPTDLTSTAPGTYLRFDGMMPAFGQGPPFYTATTASTTFEQQLVVQWSPAGSLNPFLSVNSSAIVVNLADVNLTGGTCCSGATVQPGSVTVSNGPAVVYNLMANPPPTPGQLTITFNTQDPLHPPLYGVGSVAAAGYLDTDPQSYANDIGTVSNNHAAAMQKLVAYGQYDPTTGTFAATKITINSQ